MASEGSSSSTMDSIEKSEIMKKAAELLAQGKKNMICGEVPKAVNVFEEAVQLLVKECGELSHDCADAYFNCGSALLELGRMETNVLGTALEGVDVEEEKEEEENEQFEKPPADDDNVRKQLREEVYEAMAEGEREEEFSKIITEKAIKSCADLVEKDGESKMEGTEAAVEGSEAKTNGDKHAEDVKDNGNTEGAKNGDSTVNPSSDKVEAPASKESEEVKAVDSEKSESKAETEMEAESTDKTEVAKDQAENGTKESSDKPQESNGDSKTQGSDDKVASGDSKAEESKEETNSMETEVSNGTTTSEDKVETDKTKAVETADKAEADKDNVETTDKTEAKNGVEADKSSVETKDKVDADTNIDTKDKAEADKTTETKDKVEADKDNGVESNDKKPVEAASEEAKSTAEDAEGKNGESKEADEDVEMAEASDEEEGAEEEAAEGEESQEGEETEEKEEDIPNFQLAWEYLDLAKVIYLKSESKEDLLRAAECHIKLGEVSMETEQHATAAEDLQSALKIQQKLLPADDRLIAETHYQLGLAYGLGKEFQLSIEQYKLAISVIEAKIASLTKLIEGKDADTENKENCETDELKKHKDEIKELQDLIPEMKTKIEDTQQEASDMEKMKEMAKEVLGLSGTTKGFGSPVKKADPGAASGSTDVDENGEKKPSDIAHLVRKKRKPEDDVAPSSLEIKKIRQEEGASGDAVNGVEAVNGQAKVNGNGETTVCGDSVVPPAEVIKSDAAAAAEPMST
ncbi:histone-binding protein N1/N2-like [Physella acuta]|uniref:histone-binding protein N1/N2-like n=1 Tax=Physella acuta TaxID=109671 RepID=UPI0027DEA7FE|nr:histone-binding protein N1/N2-like [Physella acuta]